MTPAQAIASLDSQLRAHGETIRYHVITSGAPDVGRDVPAFVRGFKPTELVEGITQKSRKVTLSPTNFPDGAPEKNRLVIGGKAYRIEASEAVRLANTVVRINVVAEG